MKKCVDQPIYLMGFMGTGKTTVGLLLAQQLGRAFLDTDDLIECAAKMPIAEIFAKFGEAHFRKIEREVIEEVSRRRRVIIALGGGAVCDTQNWATISHSGRTVLLDCRPETIMQRLSQDTTRPLLPGSALEKLGRIQALLAQREPCYSKADLRIRIEDTESAEDIAKRVIQILEENE